MCIIIGEFLYGILLNFACEVYLTHMSFVVHSKISPMTITNFIGMKYSSLKDSKNSEHANHIITCIQYTINCTF